jgi:hypothetical protein
MVEDSWLRVITISMTAPKKYRLMRYRLEDFAASSVDAATGEGFIRFAQVSRDQ